MITSTIKPKKNKEYQEAEFEKHSSKKKIIHSRPNFYRSMFKSKPQKQALKNSQGLINTPPANKFFGKKYQRQDDLHLSKQNEKKEYREVIISDEFVRSSTLYKMLKQQQEITQIMHQKQVTELTKDFNSKLGQNKKMKDMNHEYKIGLWQMRNYIMELKILLEEEQSDNEKLVEAYQALEEEQMNGNDEGDHQSEEDLSEEFPHNQKSSS